MNRADIDSHAAHECVERRPGCVPIRVDRRRIYDDVDTTGQTPGPAEGDAYGCGIGNVCFQHKNVELFGGCKFGELGVGGNIDPEGDDPGTAACQIERHGAAYAGCSGHNSNLVGKVTHDASPSFDFDLAMVAFEINTRPAFKCRSI
ncbi:hypothetical protein D3C78_1564430 [compost metagenome]